MPKKPIVSKARFAVGASVSFKPGRDLVVNQHFPKRAVEATIVKVGEKSAMGYSYDVSIVGQRGRTFVAFEDELKGNPARRVK